MTGQVRRNPASSSRRILFWLFFAILVLFAIKGLVVVQQFIGYASYGGQAGTITELVIQHEIPTDFWAAVYGVAVRVEGYTNLQYEDFTARSMEEKNLLFDCMQKDIQHEVYATLEDPATLDTSNLYPMSAAEVDAYFGKNTNDFDSATNTYTEPVSFQYGTTTIHTVGTATYKLGENPPTTFRIALAKTADDKPVFVALVTNFTDGFNGRLYNYQLLLPAPANETLRYYFWTDPNDVCPAGEGESANTGVVYGTVTATTGVPLENVLVEVGGVANITNSSGGYFIVAPEGNHNIYAVKTGYKVYRNNVTVVAFNKTRHDIILEEESVPNQNTGIGPGIDNPGENIGPAQQQGVGPGQDVGPGEAPLMPMLQSPKVIEGKDYIISLTELNRRLRLDQFLQEHIYVYNFRKKPLTVSLNINSTRLQELISLDKKQVTVDPNGKGEFVLTIFGVGETGIFNGSILLGGDINATIPAKIEVLPRKQLPIEALHLSVETAEKSYYPGEMVRVKTDLRNMLTDRQYPVHLFFTVQDPEGERTLWTYETNVYVKTAFSLIKSFRLPDKVQSGDYLLRVSATYLGLSSGTSTIFHVAVPFWQRSFLGLKYWLWFLILLFIGVLVGAYFYIRRQIEAKKKYHLKVEYDELPKPGPRSIYVGKIAETDRTTYFNLENFKTHTIVAGSTGGGKSVSAQVIIEEALEKGVAVVVFDPTAQWTGMLRPCKDKTMLSLYPLFGMKKSDAKAFNGNIRMITDPREKIDMKKYIKPGEIQVFCGHKLDPKDMDVLVANAIREIFHANFPENKLLKVLFVFDEVHRLLPKFGGSGDGFLQIERGCREFRKWGLGIVLISQVLSDFVGTIKANINTEIQMRTRDEGDLERIRQKYGEDVLRSLVKATVGTGMVENPAYNRGRPYFVAFRPLKHSVERLSDEEIEQYNQYNDEIDNLFYSLEQLEEEGVDVFDLKLELRLALDKVKSGNFNMVKIYLEGLKPRIEKHWQKLGKQPKQLVRELVDMAKIQEEVRRAQQEREKYVAAQQKSEQQGNREKKEWGWRDDVPPEKILNLKNGMIVINLASLYDEIAAMKDADLPKEFDPEPQPLAEGEPVPEPKNTFARWVYEATPDKKLAYALAACKTKDELLKVLEKKKNGEEFGDVQPPQWFLKQVAGEQSLGGTQSEGAAQAEGASGDGSVGAASRGKGSPGSPDTVQHSTTVSTGSEGGSATGVDASGMSATSVDAVGVDAPGTTAPGADAMGEKQQGMGGSQGRESPQQVERVSQTPVADAKSQGSLDDLVVQDESKAFRLENGVLLHSLKELREYLPKMDEETFRRHVGINYNHFADWVSGVFHDDALAAKIAHAHTKEELLAVLSS